MTKSSKCRVGEASHTHKASVITVRGPGWPEKAGGGQKEKVSMGKRVRGGSYLKAKGGGGGGGGGGCLKDVRHFTKRLEIGGLIFVRMK